MEDSMQMEGGKCGCPHHKMMAILIVLLGVLFLLGNLGWLAMKTVGIIWPILVIIGGAFKMCSPGKCKCCGMGAEKK